MKKYIYSPLIAFFVCLSIAVIADPGPPPPPPNPGGGGGGGGPVGAPIDGGLGILLAMGVAYGGQRYFQTRKSKKKKRKEEQAFGKPEVIL